MPLRPGYVHRSCDGWQSGWPAGRCRPLPTSPLRRWRAEGQEAARVGAYRVPRALMRRGGAPARWQSTARAVAQAGIGELRADAADGAEEWRELLPVT